MRRGRWDRGGDRPVSLERSAPRTCALADIVMGGGEGRLGVELECESVKAWGRGGDSQKKMLQRPHHQPGQVSCQSTAWTGFVGGKRKWVLAEASEAPSRAAMIPGDQAGSVAYSAAL